MSKIKKVVQQVEKILEDNGAHYTLACQDKERDGVIVGVNCTLNEMFDNLYYIIVQLKETGIPKYEIGDSVLSIVAQALLNDEDVEDEEKN